MAPVDDSALLRQFGENHSDEAFAELVARHVNLVYSVALRQAGHPQNAEEITQAVFIILAKKAAGLRHEKALSSWLFQATRFTAINFMRSEIRRQNREQEAQMQTILNESGGEVWPKIAPLLDDAVAALREKERRAIVLRFYEGRSLREVGLALGASEEAAKKRVGRALEKLRQSFAKRGVDSTTAAIAENISAHSVQVAPVALAKSVTVVALAKGAAASTSTVTLIKGALKIMAWTKMKTAIVTGAVVLLAAGATTVVTTGLAIKSRSSHAAAIYEQIWSQPNSDRSISALDKAPPGFIIRPTHYPDGFGGLWANNGKGVWVNADIKELLGIAYDWGKTRTIFPESLPAGNYDVMEALPDNQNAAAFRREIKRQFGLVAHKEVRDADVLVLNVKDVARLRVHLAPGGKSATFRNGDKSTQNIHFRNRNLSDVMVGLESVIGTPIVDRTGIDERYDLDFHWTNRLTGSESVLQTLREQLDQAGLELVPAALPIDMLVVEKVK